MSSFNHTNITPDRKMMWVYTGNEFLEKLYGYEDDSIFIGPEKLVKEMSLKYCILRGLKKVPWEASQRKIPIMYKRADKEGGYEGATLKGVDDVLIRKPSELYAPTNFAYDNDLVGSKIIITAAVPEFSSGPQAPWR